MNHQRRDALKAGGGLGVLGLLAAAGLIKPESAEAAWNQQAFGAKSLDAVFEVLGAGKPSASDDLVINTPEIAENGAVVPVGVLSKIPETEYMAIMIEKNPYMMAASFVVPEGTLAEVQTRVKMGETSNVHALVKAGGKFYVARKEVKVTLGGCGG